MEVNNEKYTSLGSNPLHALQRHLLHPLRRKRPHAAVRRHLRPAPPRSGLLEIKGADWVGEDRFADGAVRAVREACTGVKEKTL